LGRDTKRVGEYKCNIEWGLKVVEVHLMKHMKEAEKFQKWVEEGKWHIMGYHDINVTTDRDWNLQ
jgi:hypothetical protein